MHPRITSRSTTALGELTALQVAEPDAAALVRTRYTRFRGLGRWGDLSLEDGAAAVATARAAEEAKGSAPRRRRAKLASAPPVLQWVADQTIVGERSRWASKAPTGAFVDPPPLAAPAPATTPNSAKAVLDAQGPEAMAKWVREQSQILITDTTMRDAHQSLLATRVRTRDLLKVASHANSVLGA